MVGKQGTGRNRCPKGKCRATAGKRFIFKGKLVKSKVFKKVDVSSQPKKKTRER